MYLSLLRTAAIDYPARLSFLHNPPVLPQHSAAGWIITSIIQRAFDTPGRPVCFVWGWIILSIIYFVFIPPSSFLCFNTNSYWCR